MSIKIALNRARSGRVVFILLAVVLLGLLSVQSCTSSSTSGVNVGELAPDFTLVDLEGNQVSLSDFRGKTVFINFWTQWCPPCREEMPAIEALYQQYKDKDVVVIGVDILTSEIIKGYDENDVRQYVQQSGYSWTFVLDTTGEVTASYGVTLIPTSFFIDKEGIIRAIQIGAMSKGAMEARLATAME